MNNNTKTTKYIYFSLLFLIIVYAFLRAWYVTPLFDETASYFHYFMDGNVWNNESVLDANNHLLNSYWGHFCFENGFDHFFFFRLISVIGFIAYVFAWNRLIIKKMQLKWGYLIVLCCVSIPWILEYGALARGYSFALACWFWMIVLLVEIIQQFKFWKLIAFYTLAWLSIFTSFTFTIPVFLLIGVAFIYFSSKIVSLSKRHLIFYALCSGLFIICYYPLYLHSLALKEGGFLWWGFRHGLWQVTGKSISKVVFFTDSDGIKIVLGVLLITTAILLIVSLSRTKIKQWFDNPFHWITAYTIGILLALVVFDKVFEFNYPMDRVGMYLVPLFLILLIYCSNVTKFKWGNLLLLFFPVSMLLHLNLSTTIYSPQDRISEETYKKIDQLLADDSSISAEWMAFVLYNYAGRIHNNPTIMSLNYFREPINTDYYLKTYYTKEDKIDGYKLYYLDKVASFAIFKKEKSVKNKVFANYNWDNYTFNDNNHIYFTDSTSDLTSRPFSYKIVGEVDSPEALKVFKLHVNCTDSLGNFVILQHNNLHYSFFPKKKFTFVAKSNGFPKMNIQKINFLFENPGNQKVVFKKLDLILYQEENSN